MKISPAGIQFKAREASLFHERLLGLMFRTFSWVKADCLLLEPCNSIHTCFMKYSLDVLFVDKRGTIIKVIRDMKPWRFSRIYLKAKRVIEFPAGALSMSVKEGMQVEDSNV